MLRASPLCARLRCRLAQAASARGRPASALDATARAAASSAAGGGVGAPPRVVFLGTPSCAVAVLDALLAASASSSSPPPFTLAAVVTQPARPRGRGRASPPSPVAQRAAEAGLPVLSPDSASDPAFLAAVAALRPVALCITAAYGLMLPQAFLELPLHGTLNVHPSLLPRWRGAAPVQRCLEAGDPVAGVSVAYTVLACDAGDVLASAAHPLDGTETHTQLLAALFRRGASLLVDEIIGGGALDGSARGRAVPQDASLATRAAKLSATADGVVDWRLPADLLARRVRAFEGWPGVRAPLLICGGGGGGGGLAADAPAQPLLLKVHAARAMGPAEAARALGRGGAEPAAGGGGAAVVGGELVCACGAEGDEGGALAISRVQPPGGVAMTAAAWALGLRGARVELDRGYVANE